MSFALLTRMMRTASFGLAVLYTLLFIASVLILGVVFYLIVQTSLERRLNWSALCHKRTSRRERQRRAFTGLTVFRSGRIFRAFRT